MMYSITFPKIVITSLLSFLMSVMCSAQILNNDENTSTTDLDYIGMPVGGITAGQVYLGGDGKLWYWDIFNIQRIQPGGGGDKFYLNPLTQSNDFEQGFAIKLKHPSTRNITPRVKVLSKGGFSDISFKGEYPIGKVAYKDSDFPVSVDLNAFSPFIPTDHESSDFPAVVMEYTISNDSNKKVTLEVIGWLQNMANFKTANKTKGKHINKVLKENGSLQIVMASETSNTNLPDSGNMTLTLVDSEGGWANPKAPINSIDNLPELKKSKETVASGNLGTVLTGALGKEFSLEPGQKKTVRFVLSWYFPNLHVKESGFHHLKNSENLRQYYSKKFSSSSDVANKIIADQDKYLGLTKLWNKTWYNASLPTWFLDRTFLNTSTLATTSSYRLDDLTDNKDNEGRFYTMEGVYLGEGTCTHVFHYEQALGRVFPSLARKLRTQVDYGLSYNKDGSIGYRGEFSKMGRHDGRGYAVDGHAGTILRAYREHTTAKNNDYLTTYWPKIKKSIQYMIAQDSEKTGIADGILEGTQYNTLDRMWYGKISWTSGLYNAALRAGAKMAKDVRDTSFEKQCNTIAALGHKNISNELFNGEYFIQKLDPDHLEAPNTNKGCHSDQLLGQYWADQMDLSEIAEGEKVKKALKAIVKYNYHEQYKTYLDTASIKVSRYYALPTEPVLIGCSFPNGGADIAPGLIKNEWEKLVIGYFSEPWTGQEHQVAATLISQGLVAEGLKIEKAVHSRYAPKKRNPYNEIEYGNHYTRAMSGYAPFISASGFSLHEPNGEIGFDPKINPENFKSAFITGNAWGTFSQELNEVKKYKLAIKYGTLSVSKLKLGLQAAKKASLYINGKKVRAHLLKKENKVIVSWKRTELKAGDELEVILNPS